jgi:hypothetical protein
MNPSMTQPATAPARTARARIALGRLGRRVAAVIAECNYAQRRAAFLRMTPEAYLENRDKAPADYAEFLFRTSGALLHEPAAARRANGRSIG